MDWEKPGLHFQADIPNKKTTIFFFKIHWISSTRIGDIPLCKCVFKSHESSGQGPRAKRVYNPSTRTARGLRQLQNWMPHLSFFLSLNISLGFLPMTSWSILCFRESLRSVNHEQLPCKWHRTASAKRCMESSPARIFHRNSSGERRLKFIASGKDDDKKETAKQREHR